MAKNTVLDIIIGLKDQASSGIKKLEAVWSASVQKMKSVLTGLAIGAVAALTAGFWQLTKSVQAFAQQELGEFDVESALRAMGTYTEEYKEKLIDLANQYQKTTNIGDETWLKTFGLLTRFGMSAENVDKVTEATKNLAALMDGNLEGAALAMQRALEGEFSMFSRYGIKLDLTGDAKKDLENLFENLEKKGAGLLEARAETLSGKWQALKNSISDFQEEVGRVITDATGLKGGLSEVATWFDALQESAKNGTLHDLLTSAGERVKNWATDIKAIVEQIHSVEDLKIVAGVIGDWLKDKLVEGGKQLAAYIAEKAPILGEAIGKGVLNVVYAVNDRGVADRIAKQNGGGQEEADKLYRGMQNVRREEAGKEALASIEISDQSQQSLADRITAALSAKAYESQGGNDSERLLTALENGLSGEALDKLVSGLELTAEDLDLLAQYTEEYNTASQETVEASTKVLESSKASSDAATKASDAAVESHGKVTAAMDRSKDASLAAGQAADRNLQISEQTLALVNQMASKFARTEARLADTESQIRSMRA